MPHTIHRYPIPAFQLTFRGRIVLSLLLLVIATVMSIATIVQVSKPAAVASHQMSATYEQIVVQPGDTLWDISSRLAQGRERAEILDQILTYNQLENSELRAGQTLYVPVVSP